jgi:hypothetical protein
MIDYRNASTYAKTRQDYLLSEAEANRTLKTTRYRTIISSRLIILVGDLLIAVGMKLKAAYQIEPNMVQFTSKAHK